MSDEKKVDTSDERKPQAETEKAPQADATKFIAEVRDGPISVATPVPRGDRMLAAAGYLAAVSGFPLVVPALIYAVRGHKSRFVGFHAVQAVLLHVVLIPVLFIGLGVSAALGMWISVKYSDRRGNVPPLAEIVTYTVTGVAYMVPAAITVWLGLCALRGQPRALPILGRWAKKVVKDANNP